MPIREQLSKKQIHYDLRRIRTGTGVAATGGGSAHALLSTVHTDTEVITPPDEGSLVLANATPLWDVLLHNDTAGCALVSDATTWTMDQTPTWTGRHSWSDGSVQAYVDEDGSADFNGHVAIGANAVVSAARTLNIAETALDTTVTQYGILVRLEKTAGATDEADSFFGQYIKAELDQSGGTTSHIYGISSWARITDGQIGTSGATRYLRGGHFVADVDGGTVYDHAVGVHAFADHESGATVDGNLVGVYSQVDNDGTTNGSAILLWLDALTSVDYAIYCIDDVPTIHRGAATFGAANSPTAQVDIDQSAAAGAIPVLMLDQGDVSEQCILFSSDSTDRDINLWTVDVTGTPTATWDESEDDLDWNKNLILSAGDLKLASGLGIIHADGVVDGQVLVADGTRYIPGDISDITGGDAQFVVMALSATLANERVLVGGNSLTLTDGGAGGNATLDLDAPGTLTVSTGNAAAAPHTHAITSSSNPGSAASLVATSAAGMVQLVRIGLGATAGTDNTMKVADGAWVGLGAASGRLVFDLTAAPDQIEITQADLVFATSARGIIHVDGVAAGQILVANGTRYVPANPAASLPIAPGGRGHIIRAEAGPVWASYAAATLGAVLIGDGTDITSDTTPTFVDTVTLDDGASHSPNLRFVGGSNDDTARIRLIDDAVAGNSDLAIILVADDADSQLMIRNASGVTHSWIDAVGNASFAEYVYHTGDADTHLRYQDDRITLQAGGVNMIDIVEGAADYVSIGSTTIDSNQTNLMYVMDGNFGVSKSTGAAIVQAYSYGSVALDDIPIFRGRRARGTRGSESAVQSGDTLGRLGAAGYGATAYATESTGRMQIVASQNWTDAAHGTRINFYTTPDGSTAPAIMTTLQEDGIAHFPNSLRLEMDDTGVTDAGPTDAELDGIFGTPATVGDGFFAFVDDGGTHARIFGCVSDGTNWWWQRWFIAA